VGWATWRTLEGMIDSERFAEQTAFFAIQEKEARWWRDACLLYFQTFSHRPIPEGYERPAHTLEYYESIQSHSVPGYWP
jgi:alpha-glucuronidase